MNVQIEESWKAHLKPEFDKDYFRTLTDFVKSEYSQYQIFPPGKLIFNAFNLCPFDKVKVVIIGQDPSWTGTSTWSLFLCKRRSAFSPFISEHIQRNQSRHRFRCPDHGKPDSLGRTRSIITQRNSDGTCPPSRFTSESWLGNIYRCCNPCPDRRKRKPGIYLMGIIRSKERGVYRPQQASGAHLCPPLSSFSLQRLLRKQTFQPYKRLPENPWKNRNRMVVGEVENGELRIKSKE